MGNKKQTTVNLTSDSEKIKDRLCVMQGDLRCLINIALEYLVSNKSDKLFMDSNTA